MTSSETETTTLHPRLTKTSHGNVKPKPLPREENGALPLKPMEWLVFYVIWFLGQLGLGNFILKLFLDNVRMDEPAKKKQSMFMQSLFRFSGWDKDNDPLSYEPVEGDVYICSYPKCGFHWMGQTSLQIAWRGRLDFDHISQMIPWIEFPLEHILPANLFAPIRSHPEGIQIIKTHMKRQDLTISPKAKYIVVVRDPCDALVSAYPFVKSHLDGLFTATDWSPDMFLQSYLEDRFIMGSWAKHLAGFWKLKDLPNVLFLNFADIKKDTPATIDRMANFMGVELTKEEKEKVLERGSIDYMRKHEEAFRPLSPRLITNAYQSPMIRKGRVGGGHELYSKEQQVAIERYCKEELRKLGCSDFPYDEWFHASMVTKQE